jgi:predicted enzyme related to lactoylglutathione lyase
MKNPVSYFEIPVNDLERAIRFYEFVFDCTLKRTSIHGNEMATFPFVEGAPCITGALAKGPSYVPGKHGVRIYFFVSNIDEILEKVQSLGSDILFPKTSGDKDSWVAEFEDCEGNCIALYSCRGV